MNYEYDKINQTCKKWWQAIRRDPIRAFFVLLFLAFVTFATSFLSSIGDQLARPKSLSEGTKNKQIASIEFESEKPFVDRVVYGNDLSRKYWNVYFFQVQIRNRAMSPLHVQHLKLTDLGQWDGENFKPWDAEPVVLQWPARISKDIPPGDKVLVPFARIYPADLQRELGEDELYSGDVDIPQLRFNVDGWPRRMKSDVPPGKHRFKVTAFFTNSLPAEAELELEWPGKHRESVESMAQEIKIRKIGAMLNSVD